MQERVSSTILEFYQASAGEVDWSAPMESARSLFHATGAVLLILPAQQNDEASAICAGVTSETCLEYHRLILPGCRRLQFFHSHPQIPIRYDYLFIDEAEMDGSEGYNWLTRRDVRYYICSGFNLVDGRQVRFSINRSKSIGHATRGDISIFNLMYRHVEQAVRSHFRSFAVVGNRLEQSKLHKLRGYKLTTREIEVCELLCEGHGLESCSACLQVSKNTVRVHLQSAFRKLSVSRQQDLIRKLLTM
jgi:DNA-binding CsgD family transcriptional regulator